MDDWEGIYGMFVFLGGLWRLHGDLDGKQSTGLTEW